MHYQKSHGASGAKKDTRVLLSSDETRFIACTDSDDQSYWVQFTLYAPIADTHIMIPACAYNGNRFYAVKRKYPPMFLEEELGENTPITISDIPRLSPEGDSFMDVTTGDMAAPCVCVMNRVAKKAFMLFFTQGCHGLNHGVTLEQDGDMLRIILRAPAKRRLVYRGNTLAPHPEMDPTLSVRTGDETSIHHRIFTFDCEDVPALYRAFFEKRALLYHSHAHASLPFSAHWDMAETLLNTRYFSREFGVYSEESGIAKWQSGWIGGGMDIYALLCEGKEESQDNIRRVYDHITKYQSSFGLYYGIVRNGVIEDDSFGLLDKKYSLLLIRKHADLTYFLFKHIAALKLCETSVPDALLNSAVRAADALVKIWKTHGQLGQFVNAETGEIVVGGSASGAMAPAALCAAAVITGKEQYAECAREIGRFFYRTATLEGLTTGGPGEALQAPDSESCAALLESYMALYEYDLSQEWLDAACAGAHQLASWVVSYDFVFPKDSRFGKRGVRAAGSVWANLQNKHSAPGLCTVSPSAFFKLYRATGDERYLTVMQQIAHFIPQVASTPENPVYTNHGPVLAPGEICERVNTSDWEGTNNIGDSIFGPSYWPLCSMMLTWAEIPGIYVMPERGILCVSDHVNAWFENDTLVIENPTIYPARVKVFVDDSLSITQSLGLCWKEKFRLVSVNAGECVRIPLSNDIA